VQIPRAVYDEVVVQGLVRGAPEALTVRLFWQRRQWPIIDVPEALLSAYAPPVVLDPGETEVLALAQSLVEPLVLLDDEVARAEARRLKLRLCGTLGILVRTYREGLLPYDQAELLIREIATRPDIWISAKLCEQVLASLLS
jgi:predicted nucleic acid-binding protein